MNVETWPVAQCPKCLHAESVALNDTTRLCLEPDCRHEWDPTVTVAPLAQAPIPVPDSHKLVAVPAPPLEAEWNPNADYPPDFVASVDPDDTSDLVIQLARARELFVGRDVVCHDLEVTGTVESVDDDGRAHVVFGSGYFVDLTPDEFSLVEVPDVPDTVMGMLADIDMQVAAQVIRAGAAMLIGPDGAREYGPPPEGWLPEEAEAIPVFEHGASYAIAIVALQFGMPTDQLVSIATMLDDAATAAREATT